MSDKVTVEWNGGGTREELERRLKLAMRDLGLEIEARAKGILQPGRGVLTGTLRRSVHAAGADYDFGRDDTEAGPRTPERGNRQFDPTIQDGRIIIAVGSGMKYAAAVEKRLGYLIAGREAAVKRLPEFVEKYAND